MTPKIGEPMDFVCTVRTKRFVEMTSCKGTVRKLRTVRQAFVVDAKNRGTWVDFDILDEQPSAAARPAPEPEGGR